jgi:hypothetical protein
VNGSGWLQTSLHQQSKRRNHLLALEDSSVGLSAVERKQSSAFRGSDKGPMRVRLKEVSSLSIKKMSSQQEKLVGKMPS